MRKGKNTRDYKKHIHLSSYSNYFSEMAGFLELTLLKIPCSKPWQQVSPLTPAAEASSGPGAAVCTDRW